MKREGGILLLNFFTKFFTKALLSLALFSFFEQTIKSGRFQTELPRTELNEVRSTVFTNTVNLLEESIQSQGLYSVVLIPTQRFTYTLIYQEITSAIKLKRAVTEIPIIDQNKFFVLYSIKVAEDHLFCYIMG